MTLTVKDAVGTDVDLRTSTESAEEVPHHVISTDNGAGVTIGLTADAAVITNTTGTISSKLRGLIALFLDAIGTAADAAITTNAVGTISGKLRGIVGHANTLATLVQDMDNILNTAVPILAGATTIGGTSSYHVVSAGSTNAVRIKGSIGQVYGWNIFNNAAYPIYVKLYDSTASPPVPGSTTIYKVIAVPAGGGSNIQSAVGMQMINGIGIAIVKGIADSDNTAVLANDCVVGLDYK